MSRVGAHLALLLAAALWGFGNIPQKTVLLHMGPLTATCLRCAIAALALLPLCRMEKRAPAPGWHRSAATVAASFSLAIAIQQTAYLSATVTNASFLVNTDTIMTPVLSLLLLGEPIRFRGLVAAGLTLVGIALMSNMSGGIDAVGSGDLLCLLSAFCYALWMVALGRHIRIFGLPLRMAFWQFALAAVATLPLALMAETPDPASILTAAPDLIGLSLFGTAAAFTLHTIAQGYTTPSKAAVIVSGESIFGALGAAAVLGERMTLPVLAGAILIFAAILAVSLQPDGIVEPKRKLTASAAPHSNAQ